jgi:glycosyltransferase involved in cell wall biosynthesis
MGYQGVKKAFKNALDTFKPDVVHIHNIHSYLSPAIVKMAKEYGAKVVWTLHDYKLACPAYSCLNRGKICELCFNDKSHVVRQRCFKESLAASILAYFEAKKWNVKKLQQYVDFFVCPSQFISRQMIKAGLNPDKIKVICNFVDPIKLAGFKNNSSFEKGDYYVYVGRLSDEKGVATLLEAAKGLPYKIKLAGGGPLKDELMARYADCDNIEFLGHLNPEQVSKVLIGARATISPSQCYENNPLSVIESLCAGTPIVGANIGGIPELISDNTGEIFRSGDVADLRQAITRLMSRTFDYEAIAKESQVRFSFEQHFNLLNQLYN